MNSRTVVEKLQDNHIVITKEVRRGIPGSAKDRRALNRQKDRGADTNPWRKAERKIERSGVMTEALKFGDGVEILPMGSVAIAEQNTFNKKWAKIYTDFAAATVTEINAQESDFYIEPVRKVKKIVLAYEDGATEEL